MKVVTVINSLTPRRRESSLSIKEREEMISIMIILGSLGHYDHCKAGINILIRVSIRETIYKVDEVIVI